MKFISNILYLLKTSLKNFTGGGDARCISFHWDGYEYDNEQYINAHCLIYNDNDKLEIIDKHVILIMINKKMLIIVIIIFIDIFFK